jgi:hypothetical protein
MSWKDAQTSRSGADADEIMTSILAIEADGTSPRLNLPPAFLSGWARRAYRESSAGDGQIIPPRQRIAHDGSNPGPTKF